MESGRVERGDVPVVEILPMDHAASTTVTDGRQKSMRELVVDLLEPRRGWAGFWVRTGKP